jgi:preprotein translocase subunit SecA
MNKQRELIYAQRNKVLDGEDVKENILSMIDSTIDNAIQNFLSDESIHDNWNLDGLKRYTNGWLTTDDDFNFDTETLANTSIVDVADMLKNRAREIYTAKEQRYGEAVVRDMERYVLLRAVDTNWMEHIDAMDEMRRGIGLRAYGQHDPIVAYRNEGYDMFAAMTESIREQTAKYVLSMAIREEQPIKREKVAEEVGTGDTKGNTVRGKGVVSKNALCPCGSGKKYKRCCGKDED